MVDSPSSSETCAGSLVAVVETHIKAEKIRATCTAARTHGWTTCFVEAHSSDPASGLALLTKPPFQQHLVWHHASRAAIWRVGTSSLQFWLCLPYGYVQDAERTEELGHTLLAELRTLQPGPALLMGDLNFALDELQWATELQHEGWCSAIASSEPTCWHSPDGTSIDALLVSPRMALSMQRATVQQDNLSFPPHRPILWELHGQPYYFTKLKLPPILPAAQGRSFQRQHTQSSAELVSDIQAAQSSDQAYAIWTMYLLRSQGGEASHLGRRCGDLDLVVGTFDSLNCEAANTAKVRREADLQAACTALEQLAKSATGSWQAWTQKITHCRRLAYLEQHPHLATLMLNAPDSFCERTMHYIDAMLFQLKALHRTHRQLQQGDRNEAWRNTKARTHRQRLLARAAAAATPPTTMGLEIQNNGALSVVMEPVSG
eukprot:1374860-Amphidinium_carterae.2